MDDENDELIGRLNRLKPFEIVEDPDLEFYEILAKEEEEELEKDKYFEERERQDQLRLAKQRKVNRIEPDEPDPDFEFEELNKYANELLFSRARMKKKEFAKKLDIYLIVMKKKLINNPKNYCELKKSIEALKKRLGARKKLTIEGIKWILGFIEKESKSN